jgi:carbon monoxide dehydrogenase subunit G
MELEHDFAVPAPVERVWATFLDLEDLGTCFPGATVSDVTAEGFKGAAKVKLGPIALVYTGTGRWLERDEHAHRLILEAKGKDKRGNGTAGAIITIVLAEESPNRTFVHVLTDLNVTGKPAQFGRGVMQDVSDKLLQQFVDCLEGRFAEEAAPAAAPAEGPRETGEEPVAAAVPLVRAPVHPHAREVPDVVDLGAAAGPVLLKQFGPLVGAGFLGLLLGWLLGRRRRR